MPDKPDLVELRTNGQVYSAWTEARVSRELDTLAGDFEFRLVKGVGSEDLVAPPVSAGDACTVYVGGQLQLTGWIDEPAFELSTSSHECTIRGRGRTGDLVDCSALSSPGTWSGRTLVQIEADLLKPFGIAVTALADVGDSFPSFAIQPGEKVFEVMHRLQQQRAVLAIETPTGDVQLIRPGQVNAGYSLVQGVNILHARHKHSHQERYSLYVLKGQAQGRDAKGDWLQGAAPTTKWSPKAQAVDPGVTRYRPLEIVNEAQAFDAPLAQRAQWEATVRAGKALDDVFTVPGWRDPTGALYAFDRLVPVSCPAVKVDGETLLVKGVHFHLAKGGGQVTELGVTRKEAYSLLDLPDPKKGAGKKKGRKHKGPDQLPYLKEAPVQ